MRMLSDVGEEATNALPASDLAKNSEFLAGGGEMG